MLQSATVSLVSWDLKKTKSLFGNVFLQELNVRQEINTRLCVEEKEPDFRLFFFEFNKPYTLSLYREIP